MSTQPYLILPETVKAVRRKILAWYRRNGRHDLPWRHTTDPYYIVVSELMLQQTQVSRVIPKYVAFVKAFPTVQKLAKAPTPKLLQCWSGLGYNRRALNLRRLALAVVEQHRGKIPSTLEELLVLPGVGPYTAAAILAFAFNANVATIDTNVRRVLIHELQLPHSISSESLQAVARALLPKGKSRIWHSALMDYGSGEATARKTQVKSLSQQPKFAGSNRFYRGAIVRLLTKKHFASFAVLRRELGLPQIQVRDLVRQLEADGFVRVKGQVIRLQV